MSLTKTNVVERIHERLGYTFSHKQSQEIIEVLLEIIKSTLENGENVLISGFGKFSVKEKKERKGRNPATSETMMLPGRKVITFKCSSVLREKVNMKLS